MNLASKLTRFNTNYKNYQLPEHPQNLSLISWCRRIFALKLAPMEGDRPAGNLSFRTENGFIITAAGACLEDLQENDLVEVINTEPDSGQITVVGLKEPSSESFIHHAVYLNRSDINAVIHGHDDIVLRYAAQLNLPVTEIEQPFGSVVLMKEVQKQLHAGDYIVIRNHGFLSLGFNLEDAGTQVLEMNKKAIELDYVNRRKY